MTDPRDNPDPLQVPEPDPRVPVHPRKPHHGWEHARRRRPRWPLVVLVVVVAVVVLLVVGVGR